MVDRRSVLKFIGLAPAAIPLASDAVANGIGRSAMAGTIARQARRHEKFDDLDDCSINDDPVEMSDDDTFREKSGYIRDQWDNLVEAISPVAEREWRRNHDARRLDPDLIENRSMALHARIRVQSDRDWARYVADRRASYRRYVDMLTSGKKMRPGRSSGISDAVKARLIAFAAELVGPGPSAPDRMRF